jgi:hypothetical protein
MENPALFVLKACEGDLLCVQQTLSRHPQWARTARDADGSTALLSACFGGHADVVACLLDRGSDIDDCNATFRWTPLIAAAYSGAADVLALLLAEHRRTTGGDGGTGAPEGASEGVGSGEWGGVDTEGYSAVDRAIEQGHWSCALQLLQHGCRAEAYGAEAAALLQRLESTDRSRSGAAVLCSAAEVDRSECADSGGLAGEGSSGEAVSGGDSEAWDPEAWDPEAWDGVAELSFAQWQHQHAAPAPGPPLEPAGIACDGCSADGVFRGFDACATTPSAPAAVRTTTAAAATPSVMRLPSRGGCGGSVLLPSHWRHAGVGSDDPLFTPRFPDRAAAGGLAVDTHLQPQQPSQQPSQQPLHAGAGRRGSPAEPWPRSPAAAPATPVSLLGRSQRLLYAYVASLSKALPAALQIGAGAKTGQTEPATASRARVSALYASPMPDLQRTADVSFASNYEPDLGPDALSRTRRFWTRSSEEEGAMLAAGVSAAAWTSLSACRRDYQSLVGPVAASSLAARGLVSPRLSLPLGSRRPLFPSHLAVAAIASPIAVTSPQGPARQLHWVFEQQQPQPAEDAGSAVSSDSAGSTYPQSPTSIAWTLGDQNMELAKALLLAVEDTDETQGSECMTPLPEPPPLALSQALRRLFWQMEGDGAGASFLIFGLCVLTTLLLFNN